MQPGSDEIWMQRALELAREAEQRGEVPVGAVLVADDREAAAACNQPIGLNDPSAHAEVLVLRQAAAAAGNYRLTGSTLYVTLEPCAMCVGAMLHARVARIVYGAADPKTGALGGVYDLLALAHHNHKPVITGGVLAGPCGELLREFFKQRR
jgi:tRNA(adenine34) deaminase